MSRATGYRLFTLLAAVALTATVAAPAPGADDGERFDLERDHPARENILNLIFGSTPEMATERGILVIDAFFDRNGNGEQDAAEETLLREVVCHLDGIDYAVPAFIPGLAYDGSYRLRCTGSRYQPRLAGRNIFVRRRGEIIRLNLPCDPLPENPPPS